jgi:hypothetical protein
MQKNPAAASTTLNDTERAELARLREAEAKRTTISFKVSPKGGLSVYGLGTLPRDVVQVAVDAPHRRSSGHLVLHRGERCRVEREVESRVVPKPHTLYCRETAQCAATKSYSLLTNSFAV